EIMAALPARITGSTYEYAGERFSARTRTLLPILVWMCVSVGTLQAQTAESRSHLLALELSVPLLTCASAPEIAEPSAWVFDRPAGIQTAAQFANGDSTNRRGDRSTHVKLGALTGAAVGGVAGAVVGIISDHQASDARVQVSGAGAVLGVVGALAGALVGGLVGAFMPHS
ncbi:MAG: hypothetical protein M3Z30_09830, partial [Gemmatimonadota bacterium]|nr:hypothetical protein [Gemmatimonadota bacterium]